MEYKHYRDAIIRTDKQIQILYKEILALSKIAMKDLPIEDFEKLAILLRMLENTAYNKNLLEKTFKQV